MAKKIDETTEYAMIVQAIIDGKNVTEKIAGYSSTKSFSPELLNDIAFEEMKKKFPHTKISITSVTIDAI